MNAHCTEDRSCSVCVDIARLSVEFDVQTLALCLPLDMQENRELWNVVLQDTPCALLLSPDVIKDDSELVQVCVGVRFTPHLASVLTRGVGGSFDLEITNHTNPRGVGGSRGCLLPTLTHQAAPARPQCPILAGATIAIYSESSSKNALAIGLAKHM